MAGAPLAKMSCDKCGNTEALVKKTGNSRLLYLHCKCGCHRSSGEIFQQKLRDAVEGKAAPVSEINSENDSEKVQKISEDWKPDITTQSAPIAGISEISQPAAMPPKVSTTASTAKKIAGFGLFALAAAGLALRVLR